MIYVITTYDNERYEVCASNSIQALEEFRQNNTLKSVMVVRPKEMQTIVDSETSELLP